MTIASSTTAASSTPATAAAGDCCEEYAALSRRGLVRGLALAGATALVGGAVVTAAPARAASASSVLVVLSLRGAADGLSLVVPHADRVYYAARPRIAVPSDQLLVKDGMFGLHPRLAPLLPLWQSGRLATVHATGLPVANRSHFAAMEELEDADPGSVGREGWLNRLVGLTPGSSPVKGFAVNAGALPTSLFGAADVMSAGNVSTVGISPYDHTDSDGRRLRSLSKVWDTHPGPLARGMRAAMTAARDFEPAKAAPGHAQLYPRTSLGTALSEVARVVRADVGVEVLTVDQGEWDMHADLGTTEHGRLLTSVDDFARSVAAFFGDLGDQAPKVTLVALSEFGRRVRENDSMGLDHGYGNVMFLAGAGVKGGYHGRWPGLQDTEDADLLVTTDYRSVLSEVVTRRFGVSTATVFPGFQPEAVGAMAPA